MDSIHIEAWNNFNTSSPKVRDLTRQFFDSMDINKDGHVDFNEIELFLQERNLPIQPDLLKEFDVNHDSSMNFTEFISFFYIFLLKAKCTECNKMLTIKERRTCIDCFMSGTDIHNYTYDICSFCFHVGHRNDHQHPRSKLVKFKKLIFDTNLLPAGKLGGFKASTASNNVETKSTHRIFRDLIDVLNLAALGAAVFASNIM
ncbi:unnamed protein product [Rhodiola kirilowii]